MFAGKISWKIKCLWGLLVCPNLIADTVNATHHEGRTSGFFVEKKKSLSSFDFSFLPNGCVAPSCGSLRNCTLWTRPEYVFMLRLSAGDGQGDGDVPAQRCGPSVWCRLTVGRPSGLLQPHHPRYAITHTHSHIQWQVSGKDAWCVFSLFFNQATQSVWSTWSPSTSLCSCWAEEDTPSATWPAAGPTRPPWPWTRTSLMVKL